MLFSLFQNHNTFLVSFSELWYRSTEMGVKALHIALPVIDMGAAVSLLFGLNVTSIGDEYTHLYYGPHRISLIKTTPCSPSIQTGGAERKRSRHFGFHLSC